MKLSVSPWSSAISTSVGAEKTHFSLDLSQHDQLLHTDTTSTHFKRNVRKAGRF